MRVSGGTKARLGGSARWRAAVVAAALLLFAAAGLAVFFAYRSARERSRQTAYRKALVEDWTDVRNSSDGVVEALADLRSPSDLDILASSAGKTLSALARARARAEKAPRSMAALAASEAAAAGSLQGYLELVRELAEQKGPADVESRRRSLESRAMKAKRDLTDFTDDATFLSENINSDFFLAGARLADAFKSPGSTAGEAERQAVSEAMDRFMEDSIRRFEPGSLWPMLSGTLRTFLEAIDVTKEEFAQTWRSGWAGAEPQDYYVSPNSVTVTDGNAVVKAIVYPREGAPRIRSVRLKKEADGWKIDCYPY